MDRKETRIRIEQSRKLTGFQKKVLLKVAEIPRGQVRSYSWIGREIGSRAYRAIGTALRKNPYAPDVPCHRVIRADGSPGGYSGGIEKKLRLLAEEGIFLGRCS